MFGMKHHPSSVVNDLIVEIEAMNVFACHLANKLDRL